MGLVYINFAAGLAGIRQVTVWSEVALSSGRTNEYQE